MRFSPSTSPSEFMNLLTYIFESIKLSCNVSRGFAINGDFIKPMIEKAEEVFEIIHCCNEVGASFAAVAQARISGTGLCITTYGAGIGAIYGMATAFSERDRVIFVSTAPNDQGISLHHQISQDPQDQMRIYQQATVAQARISPQNIESFRSVLEEMMKSQQPIYLEIPIECYDTQLDLEPIKELNVNYKVPDPDIDRIKSSQSPLFYLGKLPFEQRNLVNKLNAMKCTSPMGKGSLIRDSWNLGTYAGQITPELDEFIRKKSDLFVGIATESIECERGRGTPAIIPELFIDEIDSQFVDAINSLKFKNLKDELKEHSHSGSFIDLIFEEISKFDHFYFCCDVSNAGVGLLNYQTTRLIHSPHFLSMGSSIGFALGVHAAGERALVIIGDGSFQWAMSDLLSIAKYGFDPIIILLNNSSFSMFDERTASIDYRRLIEAIGGKYFKTNSVKSLSKILNKFRTKRGELILIEVPISEQCSELRIIQDARGESC